jgi:hypothetical protein
MIAAKGIQARQLGVSWLITIPNFLKDEVSQDNWVCRFEERRLL